MFVEETLMRVWAKGFITDEEIKKSMERIVEKLKDEAIERLGISI